MEQAMKERDAALLDIFASVTRLPHSRLAFSSSHAVGVDQLSRLSIVTFHDGAIAGAVLRNSGHRKYEFKGAQLVIRKQTAAFDRLVSAPAKIAMELITSQAGHLESRFEPRWKEGIIYNSAFHQSRPILRWSVNIESSKIKVWVAEAFHERVSAGMEAGLRRLQFGAAAASQPAAAEATAASADAKGYFPDKGKGKGKKGKSKKPRASVPTDASALRREENEIIRDALGCLHFAQISFCGLGQEV